MKSTDHNINNPTNIGTIPFHRYVESWELPSIEFITKEQYDIMELHDPYTMYVIVDTNPKLMYYGDIKIGKAKAPNVYYMTTDYTSETKEYEYIIFMNSKDGSPYNGDNLIEICRFTNAQDAIDALHLYNSIGSHTLPSIQINQVLSSYIFGEISIHDCMIGMIAACGYRNHPALQTIIQMGVTYGVKHGDRDLPMLLREEVNNMRAAAPYHMVSVYANLYDVFIKYDFFKDNKYKDSIGTPDMMFILGEFLGTILNNKWA